LLVVALCCLLFRVVAFWVVALLPAPRPALPLLVIDVATTVVLPVVATSFFRIPTQHLHVNDNFTGLNHSPFCVIFGRIEFILYEYSQFDLSSIVGHFEINKKTTSWFVVPTLKE